MKTFRAACKRFLVSEEGPTAVEYAIMLSLIILVCFAAIQGVGENARDVFEEAADGLP